MRFKSICTEVNVVQITDIVANRRLNEPVSETAVICRHVIYTSQPKEKRDVNGVYNSQQYYLKLCNFREAGRPGPGFYQLAGQ